jgi:hypothetical protein
MKPHKNLGEKALLDRNRPAKINPKKVSFLIILTQKGGLMLTRPVKDDT